MSFLNKFFQSAEQRKITPQTENTSTHQTNVVVIGEEAGAFKDRPDSAKFKVKMESADNLELLQKRLHDADFLLICPASLDQLKIILTGLKDYMTQHENILCRIVTNNPVIINAIANKSTLLYPPTAESTGVFYDKLKEMHQSQKWEADSEKKILQYSLLSPIPSSLFSIAKPPIEDRYPELTQENNAKKPSSPAT